MGQSPDAPAHLRHNPGMQTAAELIRASIWARGLTSDELGRVESEVVERQVQAGAYVARKGDPVEHWIGVVSGLVKLSSVSPGGKTANFAGMNGGAWFGEGSMLKSEPRRYDVVALCDSRVALMPRATFERLQGSSIPFNRFLLEQLNERLGYFIAMVEHDRLLGPEARVARCLASMFNPYLYPGSDPSVPISQEELGYLSRVSRQRVNQALGAMEKAGLVRVDYGRITVQDLEGLRRFGE